MTLSPLECGTRGEGDTHGISHFGSKVGSASPHTSLLDVWGVESEVFVKRETRTFFLGAPHILCLDVWVFGFRETRNMKRFS